MKKMFILLLISFPIISLSQNVGIGTTTPQGKLQVNHNSSAAVGLQLIDSTVQSSGTIRFRHINNTVGITMKGYYESNFNTDNYLDIFSDSSFIATFRGNGSIGVRNGTPLYPLDVSGDINTTGALRANGNAGTSGQILRSNGDGTMVWADISEFKNFVTLFSTTPDNWTVPADVTKIMVEVWGAGGGGNILAGGGGGGYIRAHFLVSTGSVVTYAVGIGGAGAVSASAVSGGSSACAVGAITLTANGGQGALYLLATNGQGGVGGFASATTGFNNYIRFQGSSGESQKRSFYQFNATTYYESGEAGRGGNGANTNNTAGLGQTYLYNTTGAALIFRNGNSASGLRPGGGAASGIQYGASPVGGGDGANGVVIIHY